MITKGTITFFLSTKSNNTKNNTLNRIKKHLQIISKFNYLFNENEVILEISEKSWDGIVYSLIKLSQNLGTQWIITGNIDFELSIWTNNPSIIGVEAINIVCNNPLFYED